MNKNLLVAFVVALLVVLSGCEKEEVNAYSVNVTFDATGVAANNVKIVLFIDNKAVDTICVGDDQRVWRDGKFVNDYVVVDLYPIIEDEALADTFDFAYRVELHSRIEYSSGNGSGYIFYERSAIAQESYMNCPSMSYDSIARKARDKMKLKQKLTKNDIVNVW